MKLLNSFPALLLIVLLGDASAQSCSINVTPMNFGGLNTNTRAATNSRANLSVSCDSPAAFLVRLDAGQNGTGSFQTRKMRLIGSSETMDYNLFADSARTQVWGDGTGGSRVVSGSSSVRIQNLPIYGRIFGGQNLRPGSYTDTITVIVDW